MMKAAFYERQGSARDVLVTAELPTPEPAPGEVRVKLVVSGINPTDIKARTGFAGAPMEFPRVVPHQDGAGVIDRLGADVAASRLGERVWVYEAQTGRAFGTAAQYVVVPAANAVTLPDHTGFDTGACLGIAAMTAHRCLFADGPSAGKRVLVHGGGGAVGNAAILLARWAGAWVATTVSRADQAAAAQQAGANLVINRHAEDVVAAVRGASEGAGVDRIVDVNLVANLETDMACLAPSGVVSAYATENPQAELRIPFLRAMFQGFVFRYVFVYSMPQEARRQAIADITACLAADAYHPTIARHFDLDSIALAHEAQESAQSVGKILVDIPA